MKLEVHIDKKHFFIILGAILILAGAIYANAYGGSDPEIMGHNIGELEGINCGVGKYLRYTSGVGWSCETDADTDTKCNSANSCSSVCIGNDCRSSWPSGGGTGDITGVVVTNGLFGGGDSGTVIISTDTSYLQKRVSSSCPEGSSIRAISSSGGVTCEADDGGGSPVCLWGDTQYTTGAVCSTSCYQCNYDWCFYGYICNTAGSWSTTGGQNCPPGCGA